MTTSFLNEAVETEASESSLPKVSILIPAYNEEATISDVLHQILSLELNLLEVVVVDDGSSDRTAEIVRKFGTEDSRIRFFQLDRNRGKTAAIRHALQEAQGDVIVIQDADLEYDPTEIEELIEPINKGLADVVYGSRFLVRKASRVLYFYHYLANRTLTFLSNLLTNRNMTDIETCYKAFRGEVIKPLRLSSKRFGMEVEITALVCKTKARTYEVPISYYGRTYEEGKKIGLRDGVAAIYYILYYNLISPFTPTGRKYINCVNEALGSCQHSKVK